MSKRTGVIGRKLGMTSVFTETDEKVAVTVVQVENRVIGHRTKDRDGYDALIMGSNPVKDTKLSKSVRTVLAARGLPAMSVLKEFRVDASNLLEVGTCVDVSHFKDGQCIDVEGVSIGKGFAGVMKRHNFRGLEASHGVSISHRSHGSTGGRQDPGKVFKGKKMAGHMGQRKVTKQNLKILRTILDKKIILILGSVPGASGSYLYISDALKKLNAF
ncbi:50S ribosomal protein L3 [Rickettsiales endosymbiont of Paramecium tredecaurelia]|uniref:50S ribosomal protein L3 n=1 Tax=Candidatus Sarmatiella mevalonica TaxID=2770581 RepID=UPI0019246174|nr:50S ribosomal protein L3 [Candidatus Sarmatiella mevalonica]MBL3284579.1 50S ribosomal protein L3 [Candidatus Sarmatiella mevalonica]